MAAFISVRLPALSLTGGSSRSLAHDGSRAAGAGRRELTPPEIEEVVLVGGSTRVPLVRRTVEEFFGRTPHAELNPDEVVALARQCRRTFSKAA